MAYPRAFHPNCLPSAVFREIHGCGLAVQGVQQLQTAFHGFTLGSHSFMCMIVYDDTHSIEMGGGGKWFFMVSDLLKFCY